MGVELALCPGVGLLEEEGYCKQTAFIVAIYNSHPSRPRNNIDSEPEPTF